jgi:hypothetical protein
MDTYIKYMNNMAPPPVDGDVEKAKSINRKEREEFTQRPQRSDL